jgi:hypothetical protein
MVHVLAVGGDTHINLRNVRVCQKGKALITHYFLFLGTTIRLSDGAGETTNPSIKKIRGGRRNEDHSLVARTRSSNIVTLHQKFRQRAPTIDPKRIVP